MTNGSFTANRILATIKKELSSRYQLYLLVLLPVIYIFVFRYIPIYGAIIAFKKFNAVDGIWGSQAFMNVKSPLQNTDYDGIRDMHIKMPSYKTDFIWNWRSSLKMKKQIHTVGNGSRFPNISALF